MSFKCLSIEGLWHLFHHCKRDSNSFLNISLAKSLQCLTFYTDPPLPSPLDQWRGPGPGPADRCKPGRAIPSGPDRGIATQGSFVFRVSRSHLLRFGGVGGPLFGTCVPRQAESTRGGLRKHSGRAFLTPWTNRDPPMIAKSGNELSIGAPFHLLLLSKRVFRGPGGGGFYHCVKGGRGEEEDCQSGLR